MLENHEGRYALRRHTFRLENLYRCCAILLNAQISGTPTATEKLTYDFVVHATLAQSKQKKNPE